MSSLPSHLSAEHLVKLQMRVARRADQISRQAACNRQQHEGGQARERDRAVWLRAELEVLETEGRCGESEASVGATAAA